MNTKVAISIWNNRVSPVMDSARRLMIFEYEDNIEIGHSLVDIPDFNVVHKAEFLKKQGINLLICGAISRQMQQALIGSDIEVIPFIRGSIRKVINGYFNDNLNSDNFFLPGCQRNRQNAGHKRCRQQRRQR